MARANKLHLYKEEPDGTWTVLASTSTKLDEDGLRASMAELERQSPDGKYRIGYRKPKAASTPSSRAIARAKPAKAPRKAKAAAGTQTPAGTRPAASVAPRPSGDPSYVTPPAERMAWPKIRAFKYERQHHEMTKDEHLAVIEALGGEAGLKASVNSKLAMPDSYGGLLIDTHRGGRKVNDREIAMLAVFASGPETYDIRLLTTPPNNNPDLIPDVEFVSGMAMVACVQDVPMADMLDMVAAAGLDLRKPMDPVERMKQEAESFEKTVKVCDCDACQEARQKAAQTGLDLVSVRLARNDLSPAESRLKAFIAQLLKPIPDDPNEAKIRAAMARSTLILDPVGGMGGSGKPN